MRAAYIADSDALLVLAGADQATAAAAAAKAEYQLEHDLAAPTLTREDAQDFSKSYNPTKIADLAKTYPALDWPAYLTAMGMPKVDQVIVTESGYHEGAGRHRPKDADRHDQGDAQAPTALERRALPQHGDLSDLFRLLRQNDQRSEIHPAGRRGACSTTSTASWATRSVSSTCRRSSRPKPRRRSRAGQEHHRRLSPAHCRQYLDDAGGETEGVRKARQDGHQGWVSRPVALLRRP